MDPTITITPLDAVWAVLFLIVMGLEALGLKRDGDRWPTLTDVVKRRVPKWALAALFGWLGWHWLVENR